MKVVIIGGVAGGASCAARLRRLDENAEIIILEKGNYISFANCGLPYHVGGVIPSRSSLLLQTPEVMKARFNIDVRVNHEAGNIDRERKCVTVSSLREGKTYEESYDVLVIATGSSPVRPNIEGIDSERIKTVTTVDDTVRIREMVEEEEIEKVCVIGGGFIGLEMTENLVRAGKKVTLVEASDQLMNNLDKEMSLIVLKEVKKNGVEVILNDAVSAFEDVKEGISVKLSSGKEEKYGLVILAIGVRPNSALAKKAGLALGERGGIITDEHMRTSDPSIYAAGDAVEVKDFVSGEKTIIPLASPANKQGRLAADNIAGFEETYKGSQGTSIARIFSLSAASTGHNEKQLCRKGLVRGRDYEMVTISQPSHAGYYPGGKPMMIKVLFSLEDEKILGAQIVGEDGVDKRNDVIATAMRLGASIRDLKELELSYAPPFSSAKDPVNMAGFCGENVLRKQASFADYDVLEKEDVFCLDVREKGEVEAYAIPNAFNIPLGQLRERIKEVPEGRKIVVMCAAGVRAHTASRILYNHGYQDVQIYPGGARFYRLTH